MPKRKTKVQVFQGRSVSGMYHWSAYEYPYTPGKSKELACVYCSTRSARDAAIAAIMRDSNYVEVKDE